MTALSHGRMPGEVLGPSHAFATLRSDPHRTRPEPPKARTTRALYGGPSPRMRVHKAVPTEPKAVIRDQPSEGAGDEVSTSPRAKDTLKPGDGGGRRKRGARDQAARHRPTASTMPSMPAASKVLRGDDYAGLDGFGDDGNDQPKMRKLVPHGGKPPMEQLRSILSVSFGRVLDLFRSWDDDDSQTVSKLEFRRALPVLGLIVDRSDADALFDEFDVDGSVPADVLAAATAGGKRSRTKASGSKAPHTSVLRAYGARRRSLAPFVPVALSGA